MSRPAPAPNLPAGIRTAPDGSPYPDRTHPAFEREVRAMFGHIANGYENLDHLASIGQDFLWRPMALWAVDRYRQGAPVRAVLDLGCGTGEFARQEAHHYPRARVTGLDFTPGMLRRAAAHPPVGRAARDFLGGNALRLPVRSGAVDLCSSAFLLRNLSDLPLGFREVRRVLRPGGTALVLEITEPRHRAFRALFHAYFDHVVPAIGAAAGSQGPYRYLPESLRSLPGREELFRIMGAAGLEELRAVALSGGAVTAYLGSAPRGPG